MKTDLFTSITLGIIGVISAFLVTNLFMGPIDDFSYKAISNPESLNSAIDEPDPEVFNYRAINPTVEVYIGNCKRYNDLGECIDDEPGRENPEPETE